MLHEPNEFFGMHTWVENNINLFTGVLTYNENLFNKYENAIWFHHSCNFLDDEWINSFQKPTKTFEISFLSGAKNLITGHKLRKKILFKESMFHICVENIKHDYWFTEKISDAFNTKTIPVYWGCPKISEYGYDERGIIRFETIEELISIVNNLTPEMYKQMKPYVDHNYEVAKKELKFKDKLEIFFDNFIELNNL